MYICAFTDIEISGQGMVTLVQHVPVQVGRLEGRVCTVGHVQVGQVGWEEYV